MKNREISAMPVLEDKVNPVSVGCFFRFPDENAGVSALRSAGLVWIDEGGLETFITASHSHCLDVLGTITRGGEWDDEGNVITPPETLDGWHVNYVGNLPEGWEEFAVYLANPVRVWA